jgi:glycolate oxidase
MMVATSTTIPVLEQIPVFKTIVGEEYVFVSSDVLNQYASDETEDLHYLPDVVIKPRTAKEISEILKICHQHHIPCNPPGWWYRTKWWRLASFGWRITFY